MERDRTKQDEERAQSEKPLGNVATLDAQLATDQQGDQRDTNGQEMDPRWKDPDPSKRPQE